MLENTHRFRLLVHALLGIAVALSALVAVVYASATGALIFLSAGFYAIANVTGTVIGERDRFQLPLSILNVVVFSLLFGVCFYVVVGGHLRLSEETIFMFLFFILAIASLADVRRLSGERSNV